MTQEFRRAPRVSVEKSGPADFSEQPWKNGGGVTRELRRASHSLDQGRFAWRLSTATVAASGPFSEYPGIDRILMLLSGGGLAVRCGQAPEQVLQTPGQTMHFSGDVATCGRLLDGPVQDFNLMVDRALHRGEVTLVAASQAVRTMPCAPVSLFYLLQGTVCLSVSGSSAPLHLTKGELGCLQNASASSMKSASDDFLLVKADIFAKQDN